ncbi:hypothetical protein RchiOBHm_Chr1g0381881 [Rosa chinensis]|uniref:Uncharacterized protein n=1 Tax=Rosa chinensis TaxID=74649 RepID=A0A2P6SP98_ROSCH|nr:hypothetical protein RchiOBHm_Chr1g0381881 [Rosa chinensis]
MNTTPLIRVREKERVFLRRQSKIDFRMVCWVSLSMFLLWNLGFKASHSIHAALLTKKG